MNEKGDVLFPLGDTPVRGRDVLQHPQCVCGYPTPHPGMSSGCLCLFGKRFLSSRSLFIHRSRRSCTAIRAGVRVLQYVQGFVDCNT
ncbi:hypothetical protein J6590_063248 [Homalodisca vitripennis]|nr:hypothetical protein J6590_063248 [Homalodisca vitripennis]